MIDLKSIKSHWYHVIFFATAIQFIFYIYRQDVPDNDDVKSAINRAKTNLCKGELQDVADRLRSFNELNLQLRRTCNHDLNLQRNLKVGCAEINSDSILKIESPIENVTVCLDTCFSYGHSHGGFSKVSKSCYCGYSITALHIDQTSSKNCTEIDSFDWYKVNNGIFMVQTQLEDDIPYRKEERIVKIAFLLVLHGRGVLKARRLINTIYSKSNLYFIHVDKRDDHLFNRLGQLYSNYDNIILSKSRFRTIWGGTSLLRMVIESIKNLLHLEWDYLVNLSGSDFPIKKLGELEKFLANRPDTIFLKSHNIKGYNFIKKQGMDRSFYQCEDRVWNLGRRNLPRGIIYSGGSDWFALPRDFCAYVDAHASDSKSLVKPLLQVFNHTLLPVESFFHTLAINSQFCGRVRDHNLHLTNWRRKQACKCQHKNVVDWCGCSPSIYRLSDWNKLSRNANSPAKFFARKFDPTVSSSVIGRIEENLLEGNQQVDPDLDTRYWENLYSFSKSSNFTTQEEAALKEFGFYSRLQMNQTVNLEGFHMQSVDLYFNEDRFKGWLVLFCPNLLHTPNSCHQFHVERILEASLRHTNKCISENGRSLKIIEVNHGFDAGERMFRNYAPIHQMSDVAVYHEWVVESIGNQNTTDRLEFAWYDPNNRLELRQVVKLRRSSKRSLLTLAHRLSVSKPMTAGVWTLVIRSNKQSCLRYQFFIIGSDQDRQPKSEMVFNRFFKVSKHCAFKRRPSNHGATNFDCASKHWSTIHSPIEL